MSESSLSLLLKWLVEAEEWQDKATCRVEHADPEEFILKQGQTATRTRKRYCCRCPVRQECYDYGIKTGSTGIWGGEVLGLSNRESVELTPLVFYDNARPLSHLTNPPPLQPYQDASFLFK